MIMQSHRICIDSSRATRIILRGSCQLFTFPASSRLAILRVYLSDLFNSGWYVSDTWGRSSMLSPHDAHQAHVLNPLRLRINLKKESMQHICVLSHLGLFLQALGHLRTIRLCTRPSTATICYRVRRHQRRCVVRH
jgi:hypothetical protein